MSTAKPPHARPWIGLVVANLLVLTVALAQGWSPLVLLWPWWLQSVVIGYFARLRILSAARARASAGLQPSAVDCFLLHFGLFHLMQLIFLAAFTGMADHAALLPPRLDASDSALPILTAGIGMVDWPIFAALGYAFWRAHRIGWHWRGPIEVAARPSPALLMFLPYARILPMQAAAVALLASAATPSLLSIVTLKTMIDLVSAELCHRWLRGMHSATMPR